MLDVGSRGMSLWLLTLGAGAALRASRLLTIAMLCFVE